MIIPLSFKSAVSLYPLKRPPASKIKPEKEWETWPKPAGDGGRRLVTRL
jgi:hypothetical protein